MSQPEPISEVVQRVHAGMGLPWRVTTETLNRNTPEHLVINSREELVAVFEDKGEAEFCVARVNGIER